MSVDFAIIVAITVTMLGYFIAWYGMVPRHMTAASGSRHGYRVSAALLVALVINRMIILPGRSDSSALVEDGLSSANLATAVLVVVSAAWAIHLLVSQRLDPRSLLPGAGAWLGVFLAISALSIAWSSWPALTAFRVLELLCVAVLVAHVVACASAPVWFERTMVLALMIRATSVLVIGDIALVDLVTFAGLRSNVGGVVAGMLIIFYVTDPRTPSTSPPWWKLTAASYAFVLFGSLASLIALAVALLCAAALRFGSVLARSSALIVLVGILGLASFFALFPPAPSSSSLPDDPLIQEYAQILGKQPHHLANLTGRTQVWTRASEAVTEQPWGFGFAAGERLLPLSDRYDAAWTANHAHNGFVSGYLSSGLIGLAIVGLVFIATAHASLAPPKFLLPVLIFMAVNNLTAAVLGSAFHPAWIALLLLVYWQPAAEGDRDTAVSSGLETAQAQGWR